MAKEEDYNLIRAAMDGHLTSDAKRIAEIGTAWIATIIRKNTDYGSSVWKPAIFAPQLDPGTVILVRMSDKAARINSLVQRGEALVDESFNDTVQDLGAYCLLYLARPNQGPTTDEPCPTDKGPTDKGPLNKAQRTKADWTKDV